MLPEKRVLSFADARRKVVGSPEIGAEPFPLRPISADDVLSLGAALKAKDLVGLLMRHWPARRLAPPRCRIGLRVLAPSGTPAVRLRCQ
jgi:hypothetical protein